MKSSTFLVPSPYKSVLSYGRSERKGSPDVCPTCLSYILTPVRPDSNLRSDYKGRVLLRGGGGKGSSRRLCVGSPARPL